VSKNLEFLCGMVCGSALVGLTLIALKAFGLLA